MSADPLLPQSSKAETERLRLEIDGWQAALRCKEVECDRYRGALEEIDKAAAYGWPQAVRRIVREALR